jgi:hypothetical protein
MDAESVMIGAFIIVILIAAFMFMALGGKKISKSLYQSLKIIAEQHHCSITKKEFFRDFIIGMDEKKGYLFFKRQAKDDEMVLVIKLAEIQHCRVDKIPKVVRQYEGLSSVYERIGLVFIPKEKSQQETTFELFNEKKHFQLSGEIYLGEKWSELVNDYLKNKS